MNELKLKVGEIYEVSKNGVARDVIRIMGVESKSKDYIHDWLASRWCDTINK
jgi:hypothetical protein